MWLLQAQAGCIGHIIIMLSVPGVGALLWHSSYNITESVDYMKSWQSESKTAAITC